MFRLLRPDTACLERIRSAHRGRPLNYADVGCSCGPAPAGYVVDDYRVRLGTGPDAFAQARRVLRGWGMLQLGWVTPCWLDVPIEEGALVGTLTWLFGVWAVNVCRIVAVIDEDGPVSHYGLAWGTLPGHAESGEERFWVERRATIASGMPSGPCRGRVAG